MNTQLHQLQSDGIMDADAYRTCMLLTLLARLLMAFIMSVIVVCGFLII